MSSGHRQAGAAATRRSHANAMTKATSSASDASGLLETMQGHVDDIRSHLVCGICIRPLYEPFTIACGHTFCYSCLSAWFTSNKSCPDCRSPVKAQPAPAYLIRTLVHLFTSRAELMEKGETTAEHTKIQREEAQRVETDKADTNPNTGGLFKGTFKSKPPTQQPVYDIEDNVLRCPLCSWELEEDSTCVQCGYRVTHEDGDRWSDPEDNSEMSDYFDEDVEDAFDAIDDFQGGQLNGAPPFRPLAPHLRERPYDLHGPWGFIDYQLSFPHGGPPIRNGRLPLHQDELESDSEDEEFDDTDMDSFIEDDMGGQQQYDSESDHSTVVGGDEPSTQDHYDDSQLGTVPSSDYASESIEGDASEDASDDEVDEVDEEDGINEEDEEGERGEILEEYDEEGDVEGDEGVPVQPSRQTLHYNVHAPRNTRPYYPPPRLQQRRQPPHSAGSSTVNAINIDDESDEGPIGPVRRTRGRRDCPL